MDIRFIADVPAYHWFKHHGGTIRDIILPGPRLPETKIAKTAHFNTLLTMVQAFLDYWKPQEKIFVFIALTFYPLKDHQYVQFTSLINNCKDTLGPDRICVIDPIAYPHEDRYAKKRHTRFSRRLRKYCKQNQVAFCVAVRRDEITPDFQQLYKAKLYQTNEVLDVSRRLTNLYIQP